MWYQDQGCTQHIIMEVPFQDLSGDKACFCGGLVMFSQMLTLVEALQCSEDQGRMSKLFSTDLFNRETITTNTATTKVTREPRQLEAIEGNFGGNFGGNFEGTFGLFPLKFKKKDGDNMLNIFGEFGGNFFGQFWRNFWRPFWRYF